jgi:hypothetical protein
MTPTIELLYKNLTVPEKTLLNQKIYYDPQKTSHGEIVEKVKATLELEDNPLDKIDPESLQGYKKI